MSGESHVHAPIQDSRSQATDNDQDVEHMTSKRIWQTADLCLKCQDIVLPFATEEDDDDTQFVHIEITEHPACPMCRLFETLLRSQDIPLDCWSIELYWDESKPESRKVHLWTPKGDDMLNKIRKNLAPLYRTFMGHGANSYYREINPDSVDYSLVRGWLSHCACDHDDTCTSHDSKVSGIPGFKLIDCQNQTIARPSADAKYVALSYVWGCSTTSSVTSGYVGQALGQKSPSRVSRIIKDAMKVTLELGIRYLWVDQICIDQDNPVEKAEQLRWMHLIYSEATLTIVAAAGRDSAYGLPGVNGRRRTPRASISVNGLTLIAHERGDERHVQHSVWMSRGWTYQESFFSHRCLIFTDEQVLFQCKKNFYSEGMHRSANEPYHLHLFDDRNWKLTRHLSTFSSRQLTHESDILNAIDGLCHSYAQQEISVEHYWGIPLRWSEYPYIFYTADQYSHIYRREDVAGAFLRGLLWHPKRSIWSSHTNLDRGGFPSWSWTGWKAPIDWGSELRQRPFIAPVHILTTSGALVPMDERFASTLSSDWTRTDLGYTPVVQIETQVLRVIPYDWERYAGNTSGKADLGTRNGVWGGHEFTQFAIIKPGSAPTRGLIWPILRTAGNVKVKSICEESELGCFECVIVSHNQGLIVHSVNGVSKRIGLVSMASKYIVNGAFQDEDWEDSYAQGLPHSYEDVPEVLQDDFSTTHLRENFPHTTRKIRLA